MKTNYSRKTVIVLHHAGTPEQASDTDRQMIEFLRRLRRHGSQFEYLAICHSENGAAKSKESKNWRKRLKPSASG